jgi:hypothetical protein
VREGYGVLAFDGSDVDPPDGDRQRCGERAEETFGFSGDVDEDGCFDVDERFSGVVTELEANVVGSGLDAEVWASGGEGAKEGGKIGCVVGEDDDVVGHRGP